jgi:type II secretory ATPase GspE/PulE/Tfp pilus assembly ATPase PilB-like protein/CheY-like chemotaxis protein
MHWLTDAAAKAGLRAAANLPVPKGTSAADAWEIVARALGVTPTDLATKVAEVRRMKVATLGEADANALRLVPEKLARKFGVYPIREDDRQLFVASSDPDNFEADQQLAFASGRRVMFELSPPHAVAQAINVGYSNDKSVDAVLTHLEHELTDAVRVLEDNKPDAVQQTEVESAPIVKLTNLVLRDAVQQRASDIHIEPGEGNGVVRFRIDGVMRVHMQLPMHALNRVVSRIKVLAKLDIADRTRPQDGRTRIQVEGKIVDLRISTVPIRESEKVVTRILRPDTGGALKDVGLAQTELDRVRSVLSSRDGIMLVTGPTGSGKTTTLYGILRDLAAGDVNIMTVEDPVEYELKGISQIQVDTKRGVTFASALRAILRQDPDVIFVGEIRDLETAEIAVQASMTGHLVLATLHTNDAVSSVARLVDLGLQKPALAATLRGAVAQRLVRKICGECAQKISGDLTDEEARLAKRYGVTPTVRAVGCARCANTGYLGRVPVDEVAIFGPELLEAVGRGATTPELQKLAVASGMRTLREVTLEVLAAGITTLSEVDRVIGDVSSSEAAVVANQLRPTGAMTSAAVAAAMAAAGSVANADGSDTRPTVLIADDDPVMLQIINAALLKGGYRVAAVTDGAQALKKIQAGEECALLLTDLHMPVMQGDELIKKLRSDARTAALPIIVLTGSDDENRELELIDAGADDYLRKPIEPARLVARVKAALRRATG